MPQSLGLLPILGQRRVEPEELCDGDANRRKRQRCPEPREKCPLWTVVGSAACQVLAKAKIQGLLT